MHGKFHRLHATETIELEKQIAQTVGTTDNSALT